MRQIILPIINNMKLISLEYYDGSNPHWNLTLYLVNDSIITFLNDNGIHHADNEEDFDLEHERYQLSDPLKEYRVNHIYNLLENDLTIIKIKKGLNNNDLKTMLHTFSIESDCLIEFSYDEEMNYPFGLDIEDETYWYETEIERQEDYNFLYAKFHDKENFTFK